MWIQTLPFIHLQCRSRSKECGTLISSFSLQHLSLLCIDNSTLLHMKYILAYNSHIDEANQSPRYVCLGLRKSSSEFKIKFTCDIWFYYFPINPAINQQHLQITHLTTLNKTLGWLTNPYYFSTTIKRNASVCICRFKNLLCMPVLSTECLRQKTNSVRKVFRKVWKQGKFWRQNELIMLENTQHSNLPSLRGFVPATTTAIERSAKYKCFS